MIPCYCVSTDPAELRACVERVQLQFSDVRWTPHEVTGHVGLLRRVVRQTQPWALMVRGDARFTDDCPDALWPLVRAAKKADAGAGLVCLGHNPSYFSPDVTVAKTKDPGFRAVGTTDPPAYLIHRATARRALAKHSALAGLGVDQVFARCHNQGVIRAVAKHPVVSTRSSGGNPVAQTLTFGNFRSRMVLLGFIVFSLLCLCALVGLGVLHVENQKAKAWIFT